METSEKQLAGHRQRLTRPKTLAELAFACYLCDCLTNYNDTFLAFQKATKPAVALSNPAHTMALLTWLNKWGCRQFALEDHDSAAREISSWFDHYQHHLPNKDVYLWRMSDSDFDLAGKAYQALSARVASSKARNGKDLAITVGPTGAAKILFAIRPNALVPWDDSIRNGLGYDDSLTSYVEFLKAMKAVLCSLGMTCLKRGFELKDLPQKLGRPDSTVVLLLNEYYWITLTRECSLPDTELFKQWLAWSRVGF
jgi:hypothetical protein